MALSNAPPHLADLLNNMNEVHQLLEIHHALTGSAPGRRNNVEVLNKSAIVLVVACWEAYVEDLVKSGLSFMVANAKDYSVFPESILERVASKNSGRKAWNLAGDGWKNALNDNLIEVLAKTIGTLNTPKTAQVDDLFKKSLGIEELSSCWKWGGRSSSQVSNALDKLVTLRGSIAHRVQHSQGVRKKNVTDAIGLISRMAAKSHNEVRRFIKNRTGRYPWGQVKYKGVS